MRFRIRKIFPLLLAWTTAFSLFACGTGSGHGSDGSSSAGTQSEEPGTSESTLPVDTEALQSEVDFALDKLDDLDFSLAQLAGTDALGRRVEPNVGMVKDKYVGIFYLNAMGNYTEEGGQVLFNSDKIYDVTKLLEEYGDLPELKNPVTAIPTGITSDYYRSDIAPVEEDYYWGEPLYGYYRSTDPWVARKHLEMLSLAGIDFIFVDYTNDLIFEEETKALLDAVLEMTEEGLNPPKVTFMCSYNLGRASYTLGARIYPAYFSTDKYDACWFRGDSRINPGGNPLLIGNFGEDNEYADKFWFKNTQWPGEMDDENGVPWMDYRTLQHNHGGVMCVTVAQGIDPASEAYYNPDASWQARGWSPENPLEQGTDEAGILSGRNFQFKWDNAVAAREELDIVTVTGWNMWTAHKLDITNPATKFDDRACFVDCFDIAHSRDVEPMKGGYGDNYYMQLVQNVRTFKGTMVEGIANIYRGAAQTVDLNSLADWEKVTRKYLDFGADLISREWTAVDRSIAYIDRTNRNDIDYIKICNDGTNLYVAVTTKEEVTAYESGDTGWMNLYISTGAGSGWENYNYVINRAPLLTEGKTSIEKYTGTGSEALPSGEGRIAVYGNTVVYEIPLSSLGVKSGDAIEIKATDNLQIFGDIDEFYISGDSAPMGRLNYAYRLA